MNDHMETRLPEEFARRMKALLGPEYDSYQGSFRRNRSYGLRVNTGKLSSAEFEALCPFPIRKIPWIPDGYFYSEETRPARHPWYQAGLYYLQDPGAMTPAAFLPVSPGDYVLDLCAAPGGKATAAGAALRGQGLLVANDVHENRARALLRNLELFGIPNLVVTCEQPEKLAEKFPGFFNRILLDAPCSGEGMFRKDEALLRDWSPGKSLALSVLQKKLLRLSVRMLRPGGLLLYSTCTFSPEEDEEVIREILLSCPGLRLLPLPEYEGFTPGLTDEALRLFSSASLEEPHPSQYGEDLCSLSERDELMLSRCVRIYPHRMEGEGQFFALLEKTGETMPPETAVKKPKSPKSRGKKAASSPDRTGRAAMEAFFDEIGLKSLLSLPVDYKRCEVRGQKAYYLPPAAADFSGIHYLRNGLYLGDLKKDRFEPSEALALALHRDDVRSCISLSSDDERIGRYLKGESIEIPEEDISGKGWRLLLTDGYPLAFGKLINGILKNKYPQGWRV